MVKELMTADDSKRYNRAKASLTRLTRRNKMAISTLWYNLRTYVERTHEDYCLLPRLRDFYFYEEPRILNFEPILSPRDPTKPRYRAPSRTAVGIASVSASPSRSLVIFFYLCSKAHDNAIPHYDYNYNYNYRLWYMIMIDTWRIIRMYQIILVNEWSTQ